MFQGFTVTACCLVVISMLVKAFKFLLLSFVKCTLMCCDYFSLISFLIRRFDCDIIWNLELYICKEFLSIC